AACLGHHAVTDANAGRVRYAFGGSLRRADRGRYSVSTGSSPGGSCRNRDAGYFDQKTRNRPRPRAKTQPSHQLLARSSVYPSAGFPMYGRLKVSSMNFRMLPYSYGVCVTNPVARVPIFAYGEMMRHGTRIPKPR